MSVFKRPGAEFYSYDFRIRGRRFSGKTPCTTKRAAEKWEADRRRDAKADEVDLAKPMAFADAAFLYYDEVGQHHTDRDGTERHIAWLDREIGGRTLLADINGQMVARLVAKRRGEGVKPATVNRSVTEMVRKILRRAERVWGAKVAKIEWRDHLLPEPQERVREASRDEESAILAAMPDDYRPALLFALLTGCRRVEIVGLKWKDVNFFTREFRVTGKGSRSRTIPMTEEVYNLLKHERRHDGPDVFTYEAQRTRGRLVRGQRYPLTYAGFTTAWRRHAKPTVEDFRFHDTRHTAATRLVRATGNIKLAQHLLGHTSVQTTTRYAHVTHEDLRNGLEAAARARLTSGSPPNSNATEQGIGNVDEKKSG